MIAEDTPIGTEVLVTLDDGRVVRTKTRAQPIWFMRKRRRGEGISARTLMVVVEGMVGTVDCTRIRPAADRQLDLFDPGREKVAFRVPGAHALKGGRK